MMFPNAWGALDWALPVTILVVLGLAVIAWTYFRAPGSNRFKLVLAGLKLAALALLALCLLEPMIRFTRPEPGANLMVVMADDSQSLQIKDQGASETRSAKLKSRLTEDKSWLDRLENDFDVRRYQFNRQLFPVDDFADYTADQRGSAILNSLEIVSRRFADRPSAGVMMLTDGNATDTDLAALTAKNSDIALSLIHI